MHGDDRQGAAAVEKHLGHRVVHDPLHVVGHSTDCLQGGVIGAGKDSMGGSPGG